MKKFLNWFVKWPSLPPAVDEDEIRDYRITCHATNHEGMWVGGIDWIVLGPAEMKALQRAINHFLVADGERLASCSGCGIIYNPDRRPTATRRSYCRDCRESGVPERDASRKYRDRKRDEKEGGDANRG